MLLLEVYGPADGRFNEQANRYDTEPHYTIRLGTYALTPPISEQAYARGQGGSPLTLKDAQAREAARKAAQSRGDTYCYVTECFPSDAEKDAFVHAFDATAQAGGDLTISAAGPRGPITLQYPLKGLQGIWQRLQLCTR